MLIEVSMPIPKSTPKKKKAMMLDGKIQPTKKPDLDNIAKIISDALNGIAYNDDKQIVHLKVTKKYNKTPHVKVNINIHKED